MEGRTFLMLCLVVTFLEIANCTPYKHRDAKDEPKAMDSAHVFPPPPDQVDVKDEPKAMDSAHVPPPPPDQVDVKDEPKAMDSVHVPPPPPDQVDVKDEPKAMDLDHEPPPPPHNQVDEMDEPVEMNLPDSNKFTLVGDMLIPKELLHSNTRTRRHLYDKSFRWKKNPNEKFVEIPYVNNGAVEGQLKRAIKVFEEKTCIRFVKRNSQRDYVSFESGSSCHAQIGCNEGQGKHKCILSSSCAGKKGKILHEMMHILGFVHEQCRPDRDQFITILDNNIKPAAKANFAKIFDGFASSTRIGFDCDSILLYKDNAFAKPGTKSIDPRSCRKLGNGDTRLSLRDFERVNRNYECDVPTYVYYTVRVKTGSAWTRGEGTDCFVYLTLHGGGGSDEYELDVDDKGSSDLFERNSDDKFSKMVVRNDLLQKSITGISLYLEDNGRFPAWLLDVVEVYDPVHKTTKTFSINDWLYPGKKYNYKTR